MTGTIVAVALLLAALGWLLLGGRGSKPTRRRPHDDTDHDELEEAEREVQEAPDQDSVRDWGPGASRPRPPETL